MAKQLFSQQIPATPQLVRCDWLELAALLPGKTLHLGVALVCYTNMVGGARMQLTRRMMARFNLSREACYDGLRRLEAAGLVKVWRLPGRSPMVTLVEPGTDCVLSVR